MLNFFGLKIFWQMSLFLTLNLLVSTVAVQAAANPSNDLESAIVFLCGVDDISQVPASDYEAFSELAHAPLRINSLARGELSSCGLFSTYQVESLLDYRSRLGDILSRDELAVVDGFTSSVAECLAYFVDFSPSNTRAGTRFDTKVETMAGGKIADGKASLQYGAGAQFRADLPFASLGASVHSRTPWNAPPGIWPQSVGWNVSYGGRGGGTVHDFRSFWTGCVTSFTLGCFNARYGEGLNMYSGTVIESYASVEAIMKHPTGVSAYNGYSPSYGLQGAAVSMNFALPRGSLNCDIFGSWAPGLYGTHLQWNHRRGQVGLGAVFPDGRVWVDFQHSVSRSVLFGELGASVLPSSSALPTGKSAAAVPDIMSRFRALIGAKTDLQHCSMALRLGYNDSVIQTVGCISVDWDRRRQSFTLGGQYRGKLETLAPRAVQIRHSAKASATYLCTMPRHLSLSARLSTRYTGPSHVSTAFGAANPSLQGQAQLKLKWDNGIWSASARTDASACQSLGLLGCLDGAYKSGIWNVSAQTGVFRIDNWDDRIYVTHRDLPGIFGSTAMYGRGYWASTCASVDIWRYFRLYIYGDWTAYPWAREKDRHRRPSCALKMQLVCRF